MYIYIYIHRERLSTQPWWAVKPTMFRKKRLLLRISSPGQWGPCTRSGLPRWANRTQSRRGYSSHFSITLLSAWWFGTMEFYDFPYIGNNNNTNWRTHIFQRGRYTTNQLLFFMSSQCLVTSILRILLLDVDISFQCDVQLGISPPILNSGDHFVSGRCGTQWIQQWCPSEFWRSSLSLIGCLWKWGIRYTPPKKTIIWNY